MIRQDENVRFRPSEPSTNGNPPEPPPSSPLGTLTFLFTDIEGSTRLWEQRADAMREAMARHDTLIESCVAEHAGTIVRPRGEGDSRFAVFSHALDAIAAAADIQRAFFAEAWTTPSPLRVRIALHTGEADLREGDYYGPAVNRCARLRSAGHGGQTLVSETIYNLTRSLLPKQMSFRDLGTHRLKDLSSSEHIYQLVVEGLPSQFPPLETWAPLSTHLPIPLTTFVGREKEMARVEEMLRSTRLLTLTGPGGSGKTRLAVQVGAKVAPSFPNGAWLVELAPLFDPLLVPDKVVSVLGLYQPSHRPQIEILANYLRTRKMLLILDNCEHLIQAAAQLSQSLLSACPGLTILATSREAMEIPGECAFHVPPLEVPDPISAAADVDPVKTMTRYGAVQLFVDRAMAVQPDFHLTRESSAAVVNLCRRLDGIPLAIELAAARVKTLSAEQIARRLDDRFRLLTGGNRTALPRHQKLRTCIDWSYDLLSEPERILLRRLSVFPGSWSLAAVEQVCAGDGIEQEDILDLYHNLVNKSLVIAQVHTQETRDQMLETIREYALEKLVESGETERVRSRHLRYFLELAEQSENQLRTDEQLACLSLLELERDNLRGALDWATQGEDKEAGLRLAGALWWFWCIRGDLSEGRELLERMLAKEMDNSRPLTATPARARAMYRAAYLAWRQGAYGRAVEFATQSQALCEQLDDPSGVAWSLYVRGLVAQFQGDYDQAIAIFEQCLIQFRNAASLWGVALTLDSLGDALCSHGGERERALKAFKESLVLFRKTGDRWGIAHALGSLGLTESFRGNPQGATPLLEESLALYRELGDKSGVAYSIDKLGNVARLNGVYNRAAELIEEGLALRREMGNQRGVAASLGHLGRVAFLQGKTERAEALYRESLALTKELGDRLGMASLFGNFGALALARGQFSRAARLFGAASMLRQVIGAPLPETAHADLDGDLELLRSQVGEAEFVRAWSAGCTLTMEEAIHYALNETEQVDLTTSAELNVPTRVNEYAQ